MVTPLIVYVCDVPNVLSGELKFHVNVPLPQEVKVLVAVGVLVGVFVGVNVGACAGVLVAVLVGVLVGVFVGVLVGVGVGGACTPKYTTVVAPGGTFAETVVAVVLMVKPGGLVVIVTP
jgi:hypothetical protein